MTEVEVGLLLSLLIGLLIGWRLGWNAACKLYRDRTIERAEEQYQKDRR